MEENEIKSKKLKEEILTKNDKILEFHQ